MTPAEIEALLAAMQVEHTDDLSRISKCPGCRAEWEWQAKSKEAAESLLAENARLRAVVDAYLAAEDA